MRDSWRPRRKLKFCIIWQLIIIFKTLKNKCALTILIADSPALVVLTLLLVAALKIALTLAVTSGQWVTDVGWKLSKKRICDLSLIHI